MTKYNFSTRRNPWTGVAGTQGNAWFAVCVVPSPRRSKNRSFIEKQGDAIKIYPILDWDDKQTYGTSPKTICLTTPWREWATIRSGITIVRARLAIHLRRKTQTRRAWKGVRFAALTCLKVTILPFDFRKMILPEDKSKLQALIKRTTHLWKFLECDEKKRKIAELEEAMSAPSFGMIRKRRERWAPKTTGSSRPYPRSRSFVPRSKTWRLCANCARKTRKTRKWPRSLWRPGITSFGSRRPGGREFSQ